MPVEPRLGPVVGEVVVGVASVVVVPLDDASSDARLSIPGVRLVADDEDCVVVASVESALELSPPASAAPPSVSAPPPIVSPWPPSRLHWRRRHWKRPECRSAV